MSLKRPSFPSIITLSLVAIILICILETGEFWLYLSLLALKVAIVLLIFYLVFTWRKITVKRRLTIIFCIVAWTGFFYGLKW
ncbi:MAG: hypothetical protein ACOX6I_01495 [Syntrophomonadaceae bacterium]|jgi:hypothetical protein